MAVAAVLRLLKELRRRRVFRVAGLYVVAVWLLMQAANMLFPAWGIPDAAIRFLLWAGLAGFPVALAFGWVFDISAEGIRRTQPVGSEDELLRSLPLRRADYVILSAFVLVVAAIVYDATGRVLHTTATTTAAGWLDQSHHSQAEIEPYSVAVLPFADLSPERDQEHFTYGISEEILNRLSVFRELKVIARTSSFAFKDSGYDIRRISGLLGVNYLLQGSVRRDGEQLRISAQLVDRDGVQVWSSAFDRELGAIFALQDEIAEAVATRIKPQIVPPSTAPRLPVLAAYDAYLVGREMLARRPKGWIPAALEHFSRAIEIDPAFAEAHAERAIVHTLNFGRGPGAGLEPALHDVERALALRPDLPRALAAQGLLLGYQHRHVDPAAGEAQLWESLALDPNQVDTLTWLANSLTSQGRQEESMELRQRAIRLDPLSWQANWRLTAEDMAEGRFAEAEQRLLRLLEAPEPSELAYRQLGRLYQLRGRFVDALALNERQALEIVAATGQPEEWLYRAQLFARLGMRERAEYWLGRNQQLFPQDARVRLFELAYLGLDAGLIDHSEALGQAEALIAAGTGGLEAMGPGAAAVYGELLAMAGRHEEARHVLEPLLEPGVRIGRGAPRLPLALAWIYLQLGEPERAAEAGWRDYFGARRDPRWDPLRGDPRFAAVMARVKLNLDAQRAQLEASDADGQFVARLEEAIAAGPAVRD